MQKHMMALAAGAFLLSATDASAQTTYPDATTSVSYVIQDEQILRDAIGGGGSKNEIEVTRAQIEPGGYGNPSTRYRASVWFQQPFTYAGGEYHVAFIKLRELDKTGEPIEAHAATVRVSAITYRKSGDEWEIVSRQSGPFAETGTWGDAWKPDSVGQIDLNETTTALLAPSIIGGQGDSERLEQVLAFDGTSWSALGNIGTDGEGQGGCDPDLNAAADAAPCWSYKGTIQTVPHQGHKLPDLLVVRSGTAYNPKGGKPVAAKNILYSLKDGVYSSPDAH